MKLEDIGFYTLSNKRVFNSFASYNGNTKSDLSRAELLLTSRCNFSCPYCRHVGGYDLPLEDAKNIVKLWAKDNLKAIRFSGGEPTIYAGLLELVKLSKSLFIEKIAISTNGSASLDLYKSLLLAGANDLSISLDACCAEDGDKMAGGRKGAWEKVVSNIKALSKLTYVTVGVVLTDDNMPKVNEIIKFADSLGVSDIRVIPAAQHGAHLSAVKVDNDILEKHPILKYRIRNIQSGRPVRGLGETDCNKCGLILDDMAVSQGKHYPCIIYLRESGKEIGDVGPNMREERAEWYRTHDTKKDPICKGNCLDVCIDYNNKFASFKKD